MVRLTGAAKLCWVVLGVTAFVRCAGAAETSPAAAPPPEGAPPAATAAPPAPVASSKPAEPSTVPPVSQRVVFVPTGIERIINFLSQLNRDCSSLGSIEVRVLVKPEHGTVTFDAGESFSNYEARSPLARCNEQKTPGLYTRFKSEDGYVGEDRVTVLYLLPSASAVEVDTTIAVR